MELSFPDSGPVLPSLPWLAVTWLPVSFPSLSPTAPACSFLHGDRGLGPDGALYIRVFWLLSPFPA